MTSPRFCYVLLAHTDREGLLRQVARIRALSPRAAILVRHEAPELIGPADLDPFGAIDLLSGIPVQWGSWRMVTAALEAYDVSLRLTDAAYVVLVSGQDYPIRDLAAWEQGVIASGADALLDPMPADLRAYARHYVTFRLPGRLTVAKRAAHWTMDHVGRLLAPRVELYRMARTGPERWWFSVPRRSGRPPEGIVKASQWMTIRRDLLERVLAEAGDGGRHLRHLRTLVVPDEVAVQSLVARLADRLVMSPTSAMRFPEGATSPDWLTPELVRALARETSAPFARKMPVQGWEAVVAAADALSSPQVGVAPSLPEPQTVADRAAARPGRRPTARGARPVARNP
ncbi:hypothetical protein [Paracoccus sp. (in: a-proteobacteria)]|uniref:hypothetical protein n=1 Tax=Paracoccus sp. TaxID=267 RepID=UPI00321F74A8